MQRIIKKNNIPNLDIVFSLLDVSNQIISYWRTNPTSTLTKSRLKHKTIANVVELFGLDESQGELLANRAGLSLCADENFTNCFRALLLEYPETQQRLCEISQVSIRMLGYIKMGKHLKKEPLLSLLITMGLKLEEIQNMLRKAGFVLSSSLPNDAVVIWLLEHEKKVYEATNSIFIINETLNALGLPLLMTREKSIRQ